MKLILKATLLICLLLNIAQASTFDSNDKDSWIELLKEKKYTLLDDKLQELYDIQHKDISKEQELFFALSSFDNSAFELENMLMEWKKEKPDSLFALTAWGMYNTNIAFLSRGTKFINKTTSKQIAKMQAYFREAKDTLQSVIDKDPKLTVATKYLLLINMANGNHDERKKLLDKALDINPYSFIIRYQYLSLLHPKWGGSLEKLKLFMDETASYYDKNEALKKQEGYYEYILSDMLRLRKGFNKEDQLKLINKAIDKNPTNSLYYSKKGDSYYYYFKNMNKAMKNYTKALEIASQSSNILNKISKVYLKNESYDKALNYINQSLRYDGLEPSALRIKGEIYFELGQLNQSLSAYQDSLIYASENATAYTYIGYIYERKKNYALASDALLKADSIKPGTASDWYVITASQWHDRDCKFVKSAYIYQSKCKEESNGCDDKKLDWALKSAEFAKARGICK